MIDPAVVLRAGQPEITTNTQVLLDKDALLAKLVDWLPRAASKSVVSKASVLAGHLMMAVTAQQLMKIITAVPEAVAVMSRQPFQRSRCRENQRWGARGPMGRRVQA